MFLLCRTTFRTLQPRFRRLLAIMVVALLFVAGVALVIDRVLLASFESLETESIGQSTEHVVKAVQAELRQIAVVGNDYASWDDRYAFARDGNARFAELNFSKLGLREMEVDVVYVFDEAGREVHSAEKRTDRDFYSVPATAPVRRIVRENLATLAGFPEERDDRIVLRMPNGVGVVDASPIIQTERTGPSRGTVVFVRMLNTATPSGCRRSASCPSRCGGSISHQPASCRRPSSIGPAARRRKAFASRCHWGTTRSAVMLISRRSTARLPSS